MHCSNIPPKRHLEQYGVALDYVTSQVSKENVKSQVHQHCVVCVNFDCDLSKKMGYKWCAVPACANTSIKTPEKLFLCVPKNVKMRKKWLKLARRNPHDIVDNTVVCKVFLIFQKFTIWHFSLLCFLKELGKKVRAGIMMWNFFLAQLFYSNIFYCGPDS